MQFAVGKPAPPKPVEALRFDVAGADSDDLRGGDRAAGAFPLFIAVSRCLADEKPVLLLKRPL
jgi:hypothetical protein